MGVRGLISVNSGVLGMKKFENQCFRLPLVEGSLLSHHQQVGWGRLQRDLAQGEPLGPKLNEFLRRQLALRGEEAVCRPSRRTCRRRSGCPEPSTRLSKDTGASSCLRRRGTEAAPEPSAWGAGRRGEAEPRSRAKPRRSWRCFVCGRCGEGEPRSRGSGGGRRGGAEPRGSRCAKSC